MGTKNREEEPGPERLARKLYETHGAALKRWAQDRFGDDQLADEIVQETVLAAWRKYGQFDPNRGAERAWMFGIARNVAATRYRRSQRHLRAVPSAAPADSAADLGAGEEELDRLSDRSLIVDAMRALSDDHRDVVAAAYWDGLSTKEIAVKFGVPDGTVKSRLHYALRILRTQLQERGVLQ